VLAAYFRELNDRGGIYGRRVELRFFEAPGSAEARASASRHFVVQQEVFALVAPFIAAAEEAVTTAARDEKVPIVGPFTLDPAPDAPLNRQVFYLHAGRAEQARALAVFAADRLTGQKPVAAILFSESDEAARRAIDGVCAEFRRLGWGSVELCPIAQGAPAGASVTHLRSARAGVVLILSHEGREVEDLRAACSQDWHPLVLVPGGLAGRKTLGSLSQVRDRLFLAFPTLPLDATEEGKAEYERLAAAHGLPKEQRSSQFAALASAKIFVEAMTAVGRAASREKLVEQLELFYQRPTGLTRSITFGPNRRVGARGVYILGVDPQEPKLVPVSGLIELPEP